MTCTRASRGTVRSIRIYLHSKSFAKSEIGRTWWGGGIDIAFLGEEVVWNDWNDTGGDAGGDESKIIDGMNDDINR
jgi:hypothetical protein